MTCRTKYGYGEQSSTIATTTTHQQNKKSPQKRQSYNVSQEKELRKPDLKKKFTDKKIAKIATTELSIEKLEKHISCGTCPKSLQYSAMPNVAADILLEKKN